METEHQSLDAASRIPRATAQDIENAMLTSPGSAGPHRATSAYRHAKGGPMTSPALTVMNEAVGHEGSIVSRSPMTRAVARVRSASN